MQPKQMFKSGRFLKTASILAHGPISELRKKLHDNELGICGDALYVKIGGEMVLVKPGSAIMTKVADTSPYLFAGHYTVYENATDMSLVPGACSSFKMGDKVGRNLDWYYNEQADFVITCERKGAYKSIGVASHPYITAAMASSGEWIPEYAELPQYTEDGINEKGLYASINVVPNDIEGGLTDYCPRHAAAKIDMLQIVRYVLDNYASVSEAVNKLKSVAIMYNKAVARKGYALHAMLADKESCVVLEVVKGNLEIIESNASTNFWIHGTRLNEDGTVYTNASVPEHLPTKENGITPLGSGLERWNIIKQYDGEARGLLNQLLYTNTYTKTENIWYSELVYAPLNVTVDTPTDDANMQHILEKTREDFESRDRSVPNTWHTTHSSLYDLDSLTLSIVSQENTENTYDFSL